MFWVFYKGKSSKIIKKVKITSGENLKRLRPYCKFFAGFEFGWGNFISPIVCKESACHNRLTISPHHSPHLLLTLDFVHDSKHREKKHTCKIQTNIYDVIWPSRWSTYLTHQMNVGKKAQIIEQVFNCMFLIQKSGAVVPFACAFRFFSHHTCALLFD